MRSRITTVVCMDLTARDEGRDGGLGGDFLGFPDRLFLVVFELRRLESMDVVVRDVQQDLNGG